MNHHHNHLLIIFICLPLLVSTTTTTLPLQLHALLSLKSSLTDPMNTFQDWDPSQVPGPGPEPVWCKWSGIKCDLKTFQINTLDISNRKLSGAIPDDIKHLTHIHHLNISANAFAGPLPAAIFDLTYLRTLDINHNFFNSTFPRGISKLKYLTFFNAYSNNFTGPLPEEFVQLQFLTYLNLSGSYFEGEIPHSYGGFRTLKFLGLAGNSLTGEIPAELGFVTSLQHLEIGYNAFSGQIPTTFAALFNLTVLDVSSANLSGDFPITLTNLTNLETLLIFKNNFSGDIPASIGNLRSVRSLDVSDNKFSGNIPKEISSLKNLKQLSLMNNKLTGEVPEDIGELPALENLFLWNNSLTGILPQKLGLNSRLQRLDVSSNSFSGPIPPNLCLGNNLAKLILFSNSFSGNLPASLGNCTSLTRLRRCFHATCQRRFVVEEREIGPWKLTAFQRLNFTADDVVECVSMTDKILGMGSTGTVYKAEMPSGEIIAVKKLWGKHKETIRRRRGVLAEVDVLGNVRHRNIVRLLGCCSNMDSTMLLYEYMPNGSLDDLLHGKNKGDNLMADWVTRYKIALGVAQGICYLHHDCDPVIVHRDLKPSNILLDGEMEARVADFGVAKLIQCDESMSVIAGSYGYIAPEYAYTLQVDEKSDIYSFGVVLMEIISGKTSVNSEFGDGNSIVDWIRSKMKSKEGMKDVLDKDAGASCSSVREEMMLVLRVALLCTSRNPADRPSMRDVVSMLQEAKPKRKSPEKGDSRVVVTSGSKPQPSPPKAQVTLNVDRIGPF
ncbi:putative protein kinase RLK-Pelle-LRR-XI-1 family [Helianthus annuus]|nr:putative protein kinase RLK-Pelle-LRR-XI-1 family [Helianthus annuus]